MSATCESSSAWSEYLVGYGQTGELGRFRGAAGLRRGQRVVLQTPRGTELGEVLRPVSPRLGGLLGDQPPGELLRAATSDDDEQSLHLRSLAELLVQQAAASAPAAAVLDCEVLLDRRHALLYVAGTDATARREILSALRRGSAMEVVILDLGAAPEEEHGCGSCGSGGGCSTGACGTCGTTDAGEVREYFASLRDQMEQARRVTLL